MRNIRTIWAFGLATLACTAASTVSLASHNEPLRATQLKGEFLTAYVPCNISSCAAAGIPFSCCSGPGSGTCNSGNTATSNLFPACTPAVRSDPTCGFTSIGKGKFLMRESRNGPDRLPGTSDDGDVTVEATLTRLDAGCVGATLTMTATMRVTLDDCGGEACNITNMNDFFLTSCIVDAAGSCRIKTTINSTLPGTCLPNKRAGIELLGVGMVNGAARTFVGGIELH